MDVDWTFPERVWTYVSAPCQIDKNDDYSDTDEEVLRTWKQSACQFLYVCARPVLEQGIKYIDLQTPLLAVVKARSGLDVFLSYCYEEKERGDAYNNAVDHVRTLAHEYFEGFADTLRQCPQIGNTDPQPLLDWLHKSLLAFVFARLGCNALDQDAFDGIVPQMAYANVSGKKNEIPSVKKLIKTLQSQDDFTVSKYKPLYSERPIIDYLAMESDTSEFFQPGEPNSVALQRAVEYFLLLITIAKVCNKQQKNDADVDRQNKAVERAKDILTRISTASRIFRNFRQSLVPSLIYFEYCNRTNDIGFSQQIATLIAYHRRVLREYGRYILANNNTDGKRIGNAKEVLCLQRGTVFEGLNKAFVRNVLHSDPILCVELEVLPIASFANTTDAREALCEILEVDEVSVEKRSRRLFARILIRKEIDKHTNRFFALDGSANALLSRRAFLSAHRYVSYIAFDRLDKADQDASQRGLYEPGLVLRFPSAPCDVAHADAFEVRSVSARIVSDRFFDSTVAMPNRVSATQLAEHGVEVDAVVVEDETFAQSVPKIYGLQAFDHMISTVEQQNVEQSMREVFESAVKDRLKAQFEGKRATWRDARAAIESTYGKLSNTENVPNAEDDTARVTLLRRARYPVKDADDPAQESPLRSENLKVELWNRMAGRAASLAEGPPMPLTENFPAVEIALDELEEFAYAFQLVFHLAKIVQGEARGLVNPGRKIRIKRNQNVDKRGEQSIASFGEALGNVATTRLRRLRLRVARVRASTRSHRDWAEAGFVSKEDWMQALSESVAALREFTNFKSGPMLLLLYCCKMCQPPSSGYPEFRMVEQHVEAIKKATNRLLQSLSSLSSLETDVDRLASDEAVDGWFADAVAFTKVTSSVYASALLLNLIEPESKPEARCMGILPQKVAGSGDRSAPQPFATDAATIEARTFPRTVLAPRTGDEPNTARTSEQEQPLVYDESYFDALFQSALKA